MADLPNWLSKIIALHTAVTNEVVHASRLNSDRYFVWDINNFDDLVLDGVHEERIIRGSTDLFTKTEFDPWFSLFEGSLNSAEGVAWSFDSTEYEEDTGFWHHVWNWSIYA